ncbi:solute:Na+ symporter, SSS family [Thermotomaculum hydrothermale]|uniref:Solute:Na+ symporter, SSS family n=1 Tax=Thermotomaculum hydrothermale TaxID=981385 RepID=A0A7R6PY06_9BACT|nr:hypothetical protein [Thermotomaculum hydrothermale]BBB32870.1 solute:Na+ symporter, SSS family [Thermotomaculum hydrothermale]
MFAIAIAFLLIMGVISVPFAKKSKTKEGYFVSSRGLKTATLSFTLAATTIGGSAIVVSLKLIEKYGISGIFMDISGGIGLILLSFTLANRVRGTGALTLPSILKTKLNSPSYKAISIALILAEICWLALSIKGIQILGNFSTGKTAMITSLIVGYSLIGGQWSVSKTDIIQFLLIVIGLILYLINPLSTKKLFLKIPDFSLIYLCTLMLISHIIGPDIYSKLLSAKDEKTAKKGAFFSGVLKILFSILLIWAFKNGFSLKSLNAFVFLTVFSAIVSSIDSMLITSTSIICEDILSINNNRAMKLATVIIGAISFLLAIFTPNIISLLASGYTILLVAITFPALSFFLFKKVENKSFLIPVFAFFVFYAITKSTEFSFFSSLFFGGLTLAYTKIHS